MKNLLSLASVTLFIVASAVQAEKVPVYPISGSIAPYVDKDGYVNPIIELDQIDFGGGLKLPLNLNFSSAIRPPSAEFGQGWQCPLFSSRVYDVKQNLKRIELLGGKGIVMIYDKRMAKWKHYYSNDWTGEERGNHFDLIHNSGCRFEYVDGLISRVLTESGRKIVWKRSAGKLTSITEQGKPAALKIDYDDAGFAKTLSFGPDAFGQTEKSYTIKPSLIYAGIEKIEGSNGRNLSFSRSRDEKGNPVLIWADTKHLPMTLTWDNKLGTILADSRWNYQIEKNVATGKPDKDGKVAKEDSAIPWPRMHRVSKVGERKEGYYYDPRNGITEETMTDGTLRKTSWIVKPGGLYKTVRSIEETKNGKTQIVLRRAFDEKERLIRETIGLANGKLQDKQFLYDQAGRMTSMLINGDPVWINTFDLKTGKLIGRELPKEGAKLAFDHLATGRIVQKTFKKDGTQSEQNLSETAWKKMSAGLSASALHKQP